VRHLTNKYARTHLLNKAIVFVAVILLIALGLTQFARHGSTVTTAAMGRGGQFEMRPVW
jgi:sulfite exporter TauE/SafE